MFNRKLQVDVVKSTKTQPQAVDHTDTSFEDKATVVTKSVERAIKKVGMAVCAYVLLDTFRRVMVEGAKN